MSSHVAFLRAINVGGHTVKMEVLRGLFEELGVTDVSTFIASGNVVFGTRTKSISSLERKIERHLHDALGYEVATFVRTAAELRRVVKSAPFGDIRSKAGDRVHVGFLHKPPPAAARRTLLDLTNDRDVLRVRGRELYWLSHGPISESALSGAAMEKVLAGPTTMRNMNSVEKLVAKLS